ncbi:aldo/keto reductase [Paenibacillus pectinilyticus]|uniref:Aldo/keto reductase n=1 Tax=Paenibacillus pectinilyticus TaxID=512399 RepID=A0A1C0ZWX2_9BACL|nr:aldo/keto reductase [Paenibacillus pectinilyticus]OCT12596.1 aldo/keto reductase [Paenibacillus pectinilyticus]
MKYRTLGQTGLEVSALSFGASSLGSVFQKTDDAESVKTVHAAIEMGINYMDVSPYYGLTKAETVLGKAIAQLPRDKFLLSTKAGRYGSDQFDFSEKRILDSVDESLARLQTDYLDILFLHDIEFVPFQQVAEGAFHALDKLKQSGKIRFAGVSGLPLSVLEKAILHTHLDVVLSYCHYSLNDTTLLSILPLLERHAVGLVNASPLSMGLLNTNKLPDWHPASEEIKRVCKEAAHLCARSGVDIAKLAIQFSVADERIPTTLVSTSNPLNIRRNVEWANEALDEALLREVLATLQPIQNKSWVSGLPEYNLNILL